MCAVIPPPTPARTHDRLSHSPHQLARLHSVHPPRLATPIAHPEHQLRTRVRPPFTEDLLRRGSYKPRWRTVIFRCRLQLGDRETNSMDSCRCAVGGAQILHLSVGRPTAYRRARRWAAGPFGWLVRRLGGCSSAVNWRVWERSLSLSLSLSLFLFLSLSLQHAKRLIFEVSKGLGDEGERELSSAGSL